MTIDNQISFQGAATLHPRERAVKPVSGKPTARKTRSRCRCWRVSIMEYWISFPGEPHFYVIRRRRKLRPRLLQISETHDHPNS